MIRLAALGLYILFLAGYAWRDWYRALCGLILLMAVIEHPDMPKTLLGIQGLNPWNILLLILLAAWLLARRREGLVWDMPRHLNLLLLTYLAVVLWGFLRMMLDRGPLAEESTAGLVSEYLVNTVKWTFPGLLLFDGARTRQRFVLGLAATLGVYLLLGLQVIKWMPLTSALSGAELTARSLKILGNEIGYHRVNLSMMLGGASWAIFACHTLPRRRALRILILLLALLTLYAQALTGGRTGYGTWGFVGLVLCVVKWRKYLLLLPVAAAGVVLLVPGAVERMTQGFTPETHDRRATAAARDKSDSGDSDVDSYTVTAGRTLIWPYVIAKIRERPIIGYGREAMYRTGLVRLLQEELGENFPHPHNAYLQMLLDNGWVGFVLVVPFYLVVLSHCFGLLLDNRSTQFTAAGGAAAALVLALLVASMGSQTFYPREGAVGMWCAIGLMLRVWVERARVLAQGGVATGRMALGRVA
jgi:O-antigen ligase